MHISFKIHNIKSLELYGNVKPFFLIENYSNFACFILTLLAENGHNDIVALTTPGNNCFFITGKNLKVLIVSKIGLICKEVRKMRLVL